MTFRMWMDKEKASPTGMAQWGFDKYLEKSRALKVVN